MVLQIGCVGAELLLPWNLQWEIMCDAHDAHDTSNMRRLRSRYTADLVLGKHMWFEGLLAHSRFWPRAMARYPDGQAEVARVRALHDLTLKQRDPDPSRRLLPHQALLHRGQRGALVWHLERWPAPTQDPDVRRVEAAALRRDVRATHALALQHQQAAGLAAIEELLSKWARRVVAVEDEPDANTALGRAVRELRGAAIPLPPPASASHTPDTKSSMQSVKRLPTGGKRLPRGQTPGRGAGLCSLASVEGTQASAAAVAVSQLAPPLPMPVEGGGLVPGPSAAWAWPAAVAARPLSSAGPHLSCNSMAAPMMLAPGPLPVNSQLQGPPAPLMLLGMPTGMQANASEPHQVAPGPVPQLTSLSQTGSLYSGPSMGLQVPSFQHACAALYGAWPPAAPVGLPYFIGALPQPPMQAMPGQAPTPAASAAAPPLALVQPCTPQRQSAMQGCFGPLFSSHAQGTPAAMAQAVPAHALTPGAAAAQAGSSMPSAPPAQLAAPSKKPMNPFTALFMRTLNIGKPVSKRFSGTSGAHVAPSSMQATPQAARAAYSRSVTPGTAGHAATGGGRGGGPAGGGGRSVCDAAGVASLQAGGVSVVGQLKDNLACASDGIGAEGMGVYSDEDDELFPPGHALRNQLPPGVPVMGVHPPPPAGPAGLCPSPYMGGGGGPGAAASMAMGVAGLPHAAQAPSEVPEEGISTLPLFVRCKRALLGSIQPAPASAAAKAPASSSRKRPA